MGSAPIRVLLACSALALVAARGCGFTPDDRRGPGEACTRSSECEVDLECRGGACMAAELPDAGVPLLDGGPDAGAPALDGGLDAGSGDDAGLDADLPDAELPDASPVATGDAGLSDAA